MRSPITTLVLCPYLGLCLSGCAGDPAGCEPGLACAPTAPCHLGAIACDTGAPRCLDTGVSGEAGKSCGVNQFCTAAGLCGACTLGEQCTSGIAPCHTGAVACETGAPACLDSGHVADGTACTSGDVAGYCAAGACTACAGVGADCGVGGHCTAEGACVLTVTGSARITYWPEGGGSTDLGNCFGQQAEVFSPSADGGYTLLAPTSGVCTATNGTFTIPQPVPAGVYLLHFSGTAAYGNFYVETTQSVLDFGRDQAGRPDANIVAGDLTPVTFEASALHAWTPQSDTLDFVCGNVGVELAVAGNAYGLTDFAAGATAGVTSVNWKAEPLLAPTKGDIAWLFQMTGVLADSGARYLMVSRAVRLGGFTTADGTPATVGAALEAVSPSGSVALDWATSEFEALVEAANPGYSGGAHFLAVHAVRGPAAPGESAPSSARVHLLSLTAQPGQPDLALGALRYGQFLGPPWTEVLSTKFEMHADYQATSAGSPAVSYIGIYQETPLPLPAGAAVTPRLGPPLRPLVAGRDATLPQAGVTAEATLSWLAPDKGVPDVYAVAIREVSLAADGESTELRTVATFVTPRTRIAAPPGVLHLGHRYFAVIAALSTSEVRYDRAPLRLGLSTVRAETGTAIFTP